MNKKPLLKSHLNLKRLIRLLEPLERTPVINLTNPHSYRGYYDDLAFELGEGCMCSKDLLSLCKSLIGKKFEGYRGGTYKMKRGTLLWVANYGDCGKPLTSKMILNP